MHISCNGQFLAPKCLLSHSSNLSICTHMANTNISMSTKIIKVQMQPSVVPVPSAPDALNKESEIQRNIEISSEDELEEL